MNEGWWGILYWVVAAQLMELWWVSLLGLLLPDVIVLGWLFWIHRCPVGGGLSRDGFLGHSLALLLYQGRVVVVESVRRCLVFVFEVQHWVCKPLYATRSASSCFVWANFSFPHFCSAPRNFLRRCGLCDLLVFNCADGGPRLQFRP